jgi:hypothetical protein
MRNFIITEGQLNHLLEVIQTGVNIAAIKGSSLGSTGNFYYVNNPVVIDGGEGKLTSNDLSQLYGNKGYLEIKIGDDTLELDMSSYACKRMVITKFGGLQIPSGCIGYQNKNREAVDKILFRQEEAKLSGNISSVVGGNVFNKLNSLKKWIEKPEGLNLKKTVDNILWDMKNNIQQKDIEDNLEGAKILVAYNKISEYEYNSFVEKLPTRKLVYVDDEGNLDPNGKWHYVNKLNTNYSDMSDLLSTYLEKAKNASSSGATHILNTINNTNDTEVIKNILLKYKDNLKDLFEKYLEDKKDLMNFTKYTTKFSPLGDKVESDVAKAFEKIGYKVLYRGGNGNFIDMNFFVDLIMGRDKNAITIQVKSSKSDAENFKSQKYKGAVEYLVYPIRDTEFQVVDLKDRKNDFILYR